VTYSDIQGDWVGEGNIDADPLFADPQNGDFHLTWANFPIPDSTMSPCIDTGDPNSPFDPDGTIADMGTFFFDQNQQGIEDISILKASNILYQNYPNPFNPTTTISFSVTQNAVSGSDGSSFVTLEIYNLKGQKVKTLVNEVLSAGEHSVVWDGKNTNNKAVATGIYFYNLKIGSKSLATKKCLLLK
jgi:flagellar hook assembly protein FlgD